MAEMVEKIDMARIMAAVRIKVVGAKKASLRLRVATPVLRLGAYIAGCQLDVVPPATGGRVVGGRYIVGEGSPDHFYSPR